MPAINQLTHPMSGTAQRGTLQRGTAQRDTVQQGTANTNLLSWLWNLGVASYHGGSTMVHLGRGGDGRARRAAGAVRFGDVRRPVRADSRCAVVARPEEFETWHTISRA